MFSELGPEYYYVVLVCTYGPCILGIPYGRAGPGYRMCGNTPYSLYY